MEWPLQIEVFLCFFCNIHETNVEIKGTRFRVTIRKFPMGTFLNISIGATGPNVNILIMITISTIVTNDNFIVLRAN